MWGPVAVTVRSRQTARRGREDVHFAENPSNYIRTVFMCMNRPQLLIQIFNRTTPLLIICTIKVPMVPIVRINQTVYLQTKNNL